LTELQSTYKAMLKWLSVEYQTNLNKCVLRPLANAGRHSFSIISV